jgi:hypothetical protein
MSTSIRNRLRGTIEKIVSDKVVSEVVIRTAGRNRNVDHHNRFSEADESQRRRQRFCCNEGDRSVRRKGIVVSLTTTQPHQASVTG